MALRILLVEDDPDVRFALRASLEDASHQVTEVADGLAAFEKLSSGVFDLVLTDMRLPGKDGLSIFRHVQAVSPRTRVILMTSFATVADAVGALKQGAQDYLTKPFDVGELVVRVESLERQRAMERELEVARATLAGRRDVAIVGNSPSMVELLERLDTVASSEASILVTGETGTGKELAARRIHAHSLRHAGPFVAVNCAAFPETLLEAELFGHERGAFTGAIKRRDGRFKAADKGTLVLDEVAEIPLSGQVKLLRALQEGVIEPLGSGTSVPVDVRIIAATHRDLKRRIEEGRFREDLYYRLAVVQLHLPPLRRRTGDLPLLVSHFLQKHLPPAAPLPEISSAAWRALSTYPFPGNVRELGHAIQHAVILARGKRIDLEHLPEDVAATGTAAVSGDERVQPLAATLKKVERTTILRALGAAGGKRAAAAELLGISRKNLWEKLRAHGISDSDVDEPLS